MAKYLLCSQVSQYSRVFQKGDTPLNALNKKILDIKGAVSRNVNRLLSKRAFCIIFDCQYHKEFPLLFSQ